MELSMRSRVLVVLLIAAGCATLRGSTPPRLGGSYAARLAVTGKSIYTGTLSATWAGDSATGTLTLTSPLNVDMPFRGTQTGDTLRLRGSYSAANGCTGTFEAAIAAGADVAARGPFLLNDRCAGALPGVMELRR
jgi:hypothetical protein